MLPLFNYQKIVTDHPEKNKADLDNTILNLHWREQLKNKKLSPEMSRCLVNFEKWKSEFMESCQQVFEQADEKTRLESKDVFCRLVVKSIFRAELYNWKKFSGAEELNRSPFLTWNRKVLSETRPIADLL